MTEEDYIRHWRMRCIEAECKVGSLSSKLMFWKGGCIVFGVVVIILTLIA